MARQHHGSVEQLQPKGLKKERFHMEAVAVSFFVADEYDHECDGMEWLSRSVHSMTVTWVYRAPSCHFLTLTS